MRSLAVIWAWARNREPIRVWVLVSPVQKTDRALGCACLSSLTRATRQNPCANLFGHVPPMISAAKVSKGLFPASVHDPFVRSHGELLALVRGHDHTCELSGRCVHEGDAPGVRLLVRS